MKKKLKITSDVARGVSGDRRVVNVQWRTSAHKDLVLKP